ncbi:hydantoinase/oxoprolinase family protein [Thermomicrobium sp.]
MVRVGVDTGGTFTDFVVLDGTGVRLHKEPSTPDDPARAIVRGLERLGVLPTVRELLHGSTVATNAILERKGARTALVTTAGFRDVLEIGRQNRPRLYDLRQTKPPPLVPRALRFEVRERLDERGGVLVPLVDDDLHSVVAELRLAGVESVAVCLLFSFVNPEHEKRVAEFLRARGFLVSASHEISPEYREYERTSTTVLNAFVAPVMGQYLERLAASLPAGCALGIMQSNGGLVSAAVAGRQAVRTILSGPAAGAIGARAVAARSGFSRVISFDMGGTSTDVCLIDGTPSERSEGEIAGYPVRVPMLDMHTVGAGGGSIAWFDTGGVLRVGPQSAGAVPGPAAYGRGGSEPTVTDAAVVLGWLLPDAFLGGEMRLEVERARDALGRVARVLGVRLEEAAWGILEVAQANMVGAIRVITVERGKDPREYGLVGFGGAGPMMACLLASALHIPLVLIPPHPGTLSALGLLTADRLRDYTRSLMLKANEPTAASAVSEAFAALEAAALRDAAADGTTPDQLVFHRALDMRYARQSYELTIPFQSSLAETVRAFHAAHQDRYGYAMPGEPVMVVSARLRVSSPGPAELPPPEPIAELWEPTPIDERAVFFRTGHRVVPHRVPHYRREELGPGAVLVGPALVTQYDSTTVIPPGWRGFVDGGLSLVLRQRGDGVELLDRKYHDSEAER